MNHAMLRLVLSRTEIQAKMLNMLRSMYASFKAYVRCSGICMLVSKHVLGVAGANPRTTLNASRAWSKVTFAAWLGSPTSSMSQRVTLLTRGGSHGIQLFAKPDWNFPDAVCRWFCSVICSNHGTGAAESVEFTLWVFTKTCCED